MYKIRIRRGWVFKVEGNCWDQVRGTRGALPDTIGNYWTVTGDERIAYVFVSIPEAERVCRTLNAGTVVTEGGTVVSYRPFRETE